MSLAFERNTNFNEDFGNLVRKGIHSVAYEQGISVTLAKNDVANEMGYSLSAVEKWMKGHIPPKLEEVEKLTVYCLEKGRLDQDWARRVLEKAGRPNTEGFLLGRLIREGIQKVASRQNKEPSQVIQEITDKFGYSDGAIDQVLEGYAPTQPEQNEKMVLELVGFCLMNGEPNRGWTWNVLNLVQGTSLEKLLKELIKPDTDGAPRPGINTSAPPSSEFNPSIITTPGGAVKPDDQLYIRRNADEELEREIIKLGTTTTIRAPRQTGKTSLLIRGVLRARKQGFKVVYLDLQGVNQETLTSADRFLHYLAYYIANKVGLNSYDQIDQIWQTPLTSYDKLTGFIEDFILSTRDTSIVFAIDEADQLLFRDFAKDFFGLLRVWHNRRAMDDRWSRFNLVLVISTEPSLLIRDPFQSPFNVGLKLALDDFSQDQLDDLNTRHNSPLNASQVPEIMVLLGGHPYLTRLAFYILVTQELSWEQFKDIDIAELEPFRVHLRHHYRLLQNEPELQEALKEIIAHQHCTDQQAFSRLLRAGLVKGREDNCRCRCELYRHYFGENL